MPEEKIKFGTQLRRPIRAHLDDVAESLGGESGIMQLLVEAALVDFFDRDKEQQIQSIRRVRDADMYGGTSQLLRKIKAKSRATRHDADAEKAVVEDAAEAALDVDFPPKPRRRTGTDRSKG